MLPIDNRDIPPVTSLVFGGETKEGSKFNKASASSYVFMTIPDEDSLRHVVQAVQVLVQSLLGSASDPDSKVVNNNHSMRLKDAEGLKFMQPTDIAKLKANCVLDFMNKAESFSIRSKDHPSMHNYIIFKAMSNVIGDEATRHAFTGQSLPIVEDCPKLVSDVLYAGTNYAISGMSIEQMVPYKCRISRGVFSNEEGRCISEEGEIILPSTITIDCDAEASGIRPDTIEKLSKSTHGLNRDPFALLKYENGKIAPTDTATLRNATRLQIMVSWRISKDENGGDHIRLHSDAVIGSVGASESGEGALALC